MIQFNKESWGRLLITFFFLFKILDANYSPKRGFLNQNIWLITWSLMSQVISPCYKQPGATKSLWNMWKITFFSSPKKVFLSTFHESKMCNSIVIYFLWMEYEVAQAYTSIFKWKFKTYFKNKYKCILFRLMTTEDWLLYKTKQKILLNLLHYSLTINSDLALLGITHFHPGTPIPQNYLFLL